MRTGDIAVDADAGFEVSLPAVEFVDDGIDHRHEGEHVSGAVVADHAAGIGRAVDEDRVHPAAPEQLSQGDSGDSGSDDEDARLFWTHVFQLVVDRDAGDHV